MIVIHILLKRPSPLSFGDVSMKAMKRVVFFHYVLDWSVSKELRLEKYEWFSEIFVEVMGTSLIHNCSTDGLCTGLHFSIITHFSDCAF